MIRIKELTSRAYEERICTRFEYEVVDKESKDINGGKCFIARYVRSPDNDKQWTMQVVIPRDQDSDSQVYTISYIVPSRTIDLVMVAAIGLKYFQLKLKEEIQRKSEWDFAIGNIVKDM